MIRLLGLKRGGTRLFKRWKRRVMEVNRRVRENFAPAAWSRYGS